MRALNSVVGSLSFVALVACGGSKTPVIIDVPIPPDAPIDAFMCEFMSLNIDTTMNGPIDFATDFTSGPVTLNAMLTTDTPPVLEFGINISGIFGMNHPNTTLLMIWEDKHGVFNTGTAGTAGNFQGPPVAGTYNLDDDANFGAGFDILTYPAGSGGPDTTKTPLQAYVLGNMGTAKFVLSSWDVKAVANQKSKFAGEYDNDMLAGLTIDATGAGTDNGCVGMATKLGFTNVSVQWPGTLDAVPAVKHDRWDFSRFQTVQLKKPLF
jgi:hypothetical protein